MSPTQLWVLFHHLSSLYIIFCDHYRRAQSFIRFSSFSLELGGVFCSMGKGHVVHYLNPRDGNCIGDLTLAQAVSAGQGERADGSMEQDGSMEHGGEGSAAPGDGSGGPLPGVANVLHDPAANIPCSHSELN
jgi:hypothetical protein